MVLQSHSSGANLALYQGNTMIIQTNEILGAPPHVLIMQDDGILVLYKAPQKTPVYTIWSSDLWSNESIRCRTNGLFILKLENDGKARIYNKNGISYIL